MWYLLIKAGLSGVLIAVISEVAKRYPGLGGLIASLPLVSVLGMIWLWRDRPDTQLMVAHSEATFWFVLPSLPMFLVIPALLRHGFGFWTALTLGCLLTIGLYSLVLVIGPRMGIRL
jgi:F0F1-type ATP synthase assembly protein I